jgi:peptidyl-prolyl cis-trans isomerase SurA
MNGQIRRLVGRFGLWVLLMVVIGVCGCGADKKGKFTDEQMAQFPLATRYNLPGPSGGMALNVNTETITVDEVVKLLKGTLEVPAKNVSAETFQVRARPLVEDTVREKVIDILLYQQAKSKASENIDEALDKAVEMEVNRFVADSGNNYAQAQASLSGRGMDWKGYRDFQRKFLLVQSYISAELKDDKPVMHSELVEYYNTIKDNRFRTEGSVEFRVIDIIPERLTAEQIGDTGQTRSETALRIARELVERAGKGEDFAELAKTYSNDLRATTGGLWRPIETGKGVLAKPFDVLETEAVKLEPGQVAGPIVAEGHVFILRLESKKAAGEMSFAEVQKQIENEVKLIKKKQRYDKMLDKIIAQADIKNLDQFVDHCTAEAYRRYRMEEGK